MSHYNIIIFYLVIRRKFSTINTEIRYPITKILKSVVLLTDTVKILTSKDPGWETQTQSSHICHICMMDSQYRTAKVSSGISDTTSLTPKFTLSRFNSLFNPPITLSNPLSTVEPVSNTITLSLYQVDFLCNRPYIIRELFTVGGSSRRGDDEDNDGDTS